MMKPNQSCFRAGLLAGLLLLAPGWAEAATATLVEVRGRVEIIAAGIGAEAPPRPAAAGMPINPGETLRLGPDSGARVRLSDGSEVQAFPRTELFFDQDLSDPQAVGSVFGVVMGWISSKVRPRKEGGEPFAVITPSSVAGVRGTEFEVAVSDDGGSRVSVEAGEVEVAGTGGSEMVPAGSETEVEVGGRPRAPVRARLAPGDFEGWLRERNARFRERFGERVAALAQAARAFDARAAELGRELTALGEETRRLTRERGEALRAGNRTRAEEIETQIRARVGEGAALARQALETGGMRIASLRLSERGLSGLAPGAKLPPELGQVKRELEALRASLREKFQAEKETLRRRLEELRGLRLERRPAPGPEAGAGVDPEALARWNRMTPAEREELRGKFRAWQGLSEEKKAEVLANFERFRKMSKKARREVVKSYRDFGRLALAERNLVRERFARWRLLPPERREEIRKKFRRFQSLSPEEREAILERLQREGGAPGPLRPGGR